MKFLLCLAVLLGVVYAEFCDHDADCHVIVCGANFKPDCYERFGTHVCTCVADVDTVTCNNPDQCQAGLGDCTRTDHKWHCFDNKCRCGFFG